MDTVPEDSFMMNATFIEKAFVPIVELPDVGESKIIPVVKPVPIKPVGTKQPSGLTDLLDRGLPYDQAYTLYKNRRSRNNIAARKSRQKKRSAMCEAFFLCQDRLKITNSADEARFIASLMKVLC